MGQERISNLLKYKPLMGLKKQRGGGVCTVIVGKDNSANRIGIDIKSKY